MLTQEEISHNAEMEVRKSIARLNHEAYIEDLKNKKEQFKINNPDMLDIADRMFNAVRAPQSFFLV